VGIFDRLFRKNSASLEASNTNVSPEDFLFGLVDDIQAREAAGGFESLSQVEGVFFCVWTVEAEVNNGGFHQFFFNSSGDIANRVPGALRGIGAGHTAAIVEHANSEFGPSGPSVDHAIREQQLLDLGDAAEEQFELLDSEFLEYRDNLSSLLAVYMRQSM
jgi:hypothetical protein